MPPPARRYNSSHRRIHSGGFTVSRAVRPGNAYVCAAYAGGGVRDLLPGAVGDEPSRKGQRLGRARGFSGFGDADPQYGSGLSASCAERGGRADLSAFSHRSLGTGGREARCSWGRRVTGWKPG